jgi:DNA polymerase III delta prime subunit
MNIEGLTGHKQQIKNLNYLLKNENIPHAILFTGQSGIGKKTIGKRFLNSLLCKNENPPCLSCPVCSQIKHGTFPDYIEIEPNDKGIIPIGNQDKLEPGSVRWLIDRLTKKSIFGKTGILIDGVDRITEEGQNALLKTTEEPSLDAYFIMISSNRAKILPTILSRCSEIRFHPLSDNEIRQLIKNSNLSLQNSELVTYMSGGSIETASILSDANILNEILSVCGKISSYWKSSDILDADITPLQKKIGHSKLLDIIINLLRRNLMTNIKREDAVPPSLKEIFIDNSEFISYLIKIFLALKKSESQNINLKHALKGMIYAFNSSRTLNLPLLNI